MLVRSSTVYKNKKVKEKNIMFKKQILKLKHGKRLIGA